MSHFVTIVIGVEKSNLEDALAPFYEGSEDPQYRVFVNDEETYRKQFDTESIKMRRLANGELKYTWDREFQTGGFVNRTTTFPEGSEEVDVAHNDRYASFEEFMKDFCGSDSRDDEHGVYGHYTNPNAHWDWWVIGGRWMGYFNVKPGAHTELGRAGTFDNAPRPGTADILRMKDWDLDAQRQIAADEAGERYAKFFALLGEHPLPVTWDEIRKEHPDIDAAREAYASQPTMVHLKAVDTEHEFQGFGSEPGAEFNCTLEVYQQRARARTGVPFAILKDGVWYERGRMGWWGCVSDEANPDEWSAKVAELFDGLDPETPLACIDCHI